MNDILKVENLNKSYKNFSLTDVTFSLPEGLYNRFYWYQWCRKNYYVTHNFRIDTKNFR